MENMCGIKMFSAQDICKGLHVTKETAYAIMKMKESGARYGTCYMRVFVKVNVYPFALYTFKECIYSAFDFSQNVLVSCAVFVDDGNWSKGFCTMTRIIHPKII